MATDEEDNMYGSEDLGDEDEDLEDENITEVKKIIGHLPKIELKKRSNSVEVETLIDQEFDIELKKRSKSDTRLQKKKYRKKV